MPVTPTGRLFPMLLVALVLAACAGILGSYLLPHHHRDISDGASGPPGALAPSGKPGGG